jgi:hypothetical protein
LLSLEIGVQDECAGLIQKFLVCEQTGDLPEAHSGFDLDDLFHRAGTGGSIAVVIQEDDKDDPCDTHHCKE